MVPPLIKIKRALVTGGAGFIGSHVVDRLVSDGAAVVVYDNFATGQEAHLQRHAGNPQVSVVRGDVLDLGRLGEAMAGADFVFHMQANADVRGGIHRTRIDLEQNTTATWNVLESMRIHEVKGMMFASSGTVYGEPNVFPTPEDYAPLQTSLYGASKLAGEAMIQAFSEYFGFRYFIFRFVSWIGERYSHGVIFDFLKKLKANPGELEILGDGRQRKSYLDVRDGVNGIFHAIAMSTDRRNVFNLGHDDFLDVLSLARIVIESAGLSGVGLRTTGGERGWVGDSPLVHLDTTRLKRLGWKAEVPIEDGIRQTVHYLMSHPELIERR